MARAQCPSRSITWLLWLLLTVAGALLAGPLGAHDFTASVVKVRAVDAEGSESFGSAVVVAPDLLATACHVTRDARVIEVSHGAERRLAAAQSGSLIHDLCL